MQRCCFIRALGAYTFGAVFVSGTLGGCALVHNLRGNNASMKASQPPDDVADEPAGVTHVMAMQPEATPTQTASPEDLAQASAALERGIAGYHRGDYAAAEQALKEALVLHPFLAPAHLALGKIYLIRGIAADDRRRLIKGRRMVEMALKLDPKLTDAGIYLALFP